MRRSLIGQIEFTDGFSAGTNSLAESGNTSAIGSCNSLLLGAGVSVPFGGYDSFGSNSGSRYMTQVGNVWGGLKDIGMTQGAGSLFEDVGKSLWTIGAGQAHKEGANIPGLIAASVLQVSVPVGGVYSALNTFDAGMPQPSAPDIGIPTTIGVGYTGLIDGAVSVKLVGLRLKTGGASRPSTTSAVVVPQKQTVRVTFPTASDGQDNWAVFFTQMGFGGVGLHFRVTYNDALDIPESVVAAGTAGGIPRSLEFEYQDGDLSGREIAEVSYIDNYAPPAGTHAVRLENVMCVLGCYADSTASASSTNPGTCIAVSLPNFYESFKPRNLLFLPEQVVDVLARPSDSYAWIGLRNSICTLQYTGNTDGVPCTLAVAFPNIGIKYAKNWTQFYGRLAIFTAKSSLVILDEEGNLDEAFAAPVKKILAQATPENTTLGFDFETQSLVVAIGDFTISYSIENRKWSDPVYLDDCNVAGYVLSCVPSDGKLIVTVANGAAHTAYTYNQGAAQMPIVKVSRWQSDSYAKNIYELQTAAHITKPNYPFAVAIQRNLRPIAGRGISTTAGSNQLMLGANLFRSSETGDRIFVYAENVGGANVHYLLGRVGSVVNASTITIIDETGSALNAAVTTSVAVALIGDYVDVVTPTISGEQHFANFNPNMVEARSYQVGLFMVTNAEQGEFSGVTVSGTALMTNAVAVN